MLGYSISSTILDEIRSGRIFGVVEVDFSVPDSLKGYFEEMPPVFKSISVKNEDIGSFMQDFLKKTGQTFKDTRYLIGSMFGEKILIITLLMLRYIDHRLIVKLILNINILFIYMGLFTLEKRMV